MIAPGELGKASPRKVAAREHRDDVQQSFLPRSITTHFRTESATMASKRDMRRPDLSKHFSARLNWEISRWLTCDRSCYSRPLPGAPSQGRERRVLLDAVVHAAHGRDAHAQQVHRMVRENTPLIPRRPLFDTWQVGMPGQVADTIRKCRASVVFSVQTWLGESEETKKSSATPGYFSVGMSGTFPSRSCGPGWQTANGRATVMALAVTYLPMFLPPPVQRGAATGTGPAAPVPPA